MQSQPGPVRPGQTVPNDSLNATNSSCNVCYLDIRQYRDANDELSFKVRFPMVLGHPQKTFTRRQRAALPPMATRDWPRTCSQKWVNTDHFMKTRIFVALCVVLGVSFISARADNDTPEQAAARAALKQKMLELDRSPAQPSAAANSAALVAQPGGSTTSATGTLAANAATSQTAPAATTLVAAPTTVAPTVTPEGKVSTPVAPAEATPVAAAPAAAISTPEVTAATTPEMAAALAAMEQKMYDLNHPKAQSPPGKNSMAAVTQPGESTPQTADTASATATAPETAPAATATVTAPDNKAPAADAAPVVVAPVAVPEAPAPATPAAAAPVVKAPAVTATVAPAAITPVVAPNAVAPVSVAPAAVVPAPKVSTAPVIVVPVAVAPAVTVPSAAAPTKTQPAAAEPSALVLHAATLPSSSSRLVRPAIKLVTLTGSIYQNVEVERVMADAIIISYTPAGGGSAMTKVNLSDLPDGFRQRYQKK